MNPKTCHQGLGITSQNQKILLFHHDSSSPKNTFQIDKSADGFDFKPSTKQAEIIKTNGSQELIKKCQDFRISEFDGLHFLFYKFQDEQRSSLCSAKSFDLIHWQYLGKVSALEETGMLVPNFKRQDHYVLYFGEKSIKIAFSEDLENWKILKTPVFQLANEKTHLKIADLIITDKGILLIYFLKREEKRKSYYSLHALLFDDQNPTQPIWHSDEPIWEQPPKWRQKVSPVGVQRLDNLLISYWQTAQGTIFGLPHHNFATLLKEVESFFLFPLLRKFKKNPILRPIVDHLWESQAVFNPAAVYEEDKVHLIYRAVGDKGVSVLGYAQSRDGIHIDQRLKKPIYVPKQHFEGQGHLHKTPPLCSLPYMSGGGCGGCEDPRLTKIDNRFYLVYVAYDGCGPPRLALNSIKSDDFLSHRWHWEEPVLISPPGIVDKSGCVLPEKIKGKYVIFHRVFPHILIDFVESLKFDGQTYLQGQYRISPRENAWDSRKIGVGPPPIKTQDGWLVIYNAVDDKDASRYKIGAMLLDLKDPTQVLFRSNKPLLEPTQDYENNGLKFGVVYPCGAAVIKNKLFVYYGGSDTFVCVATAQLSQFLNQLKISGSSSLKPVTSLNISPTQSPND